MNDTLNANGYNWAYTEVPSLGSIPGQNNNNPLSIFGLHLVLKIGDTYYDPSYGRIYTGVGQFEEDCVAGYFYVVEDTADETFYHIDFTGDNDQDDTTAPVWSYRFRANTAGTQMQEIGL
jgi:hypothetical protein